MTVLLFQIIRKSLSLLYCPKNSRSRRNPSLLTSRDLFKYGVIYTEFVSQIEVK
jgi:hypothetical protein